MYMIFLSMKIFEILLNLLIIFFFLVHSFTAVQTYQYMYDFFKYKRWKLFPIREGSSDPFSNMYDIYN